jgi:long-chain acyl-CoA synthetase
VENICICTQPHSNHLTALISPNRRMMAELALQLTAKSRLSFDELCDDGEVYEHVARSLEHRGSTLAFSRKELPVRFVLVKEEWSPDNNLLTAALKMRRKQVYAFYRKEIERMFAQIEQD